MAGRSSLSLTDSQAQRRNPQILCNFQAYTSRYICSNPKRQIQSPTFIGTALTGMTRDGVQFDAAKRSYRNSKAEGNRHEEAKWANVIGNILKNRGEYVKALKWFRIDYDVSVKYLPQKHMLATCQSLGEVYLRLEHFKDALIYQVRFWLWIAFVPRNVWS